MFDRCSGTLYEPLVLHPAAQEVRLTYGFFSPSWLKADWQSEPLVFTEQELQREYRVAKHWEYKLAKGFHKR